MPETSDITHAATEFTGKRAVVVGASRGLGQAVARDLLARGARVAVLARDVDTVRAAVENHPNAIALAADVADGDSVASAFVEIGEILGGLDLAVNAAGVFSPPNPAGELDPEELRRTLEINVVGLQRVMQAEIQLMGTGGAIVNFSSAIGPHRTVPGLAAYGASKAAVSALSRAAALDHIRDGIRINVLSPGASDTAMSFRAGEDAAARDARVRATNPLGRVNSIAEVVAAVRYLLSDSSASVVGTDLVIDGGASA